MVLLGKMGMDIFDVVKVGGIIEVCIRE